MKLVAPAAIDINSGKRLQIVRITLHHIDRVTCEPALPAFLDALASLKIAWQAKAECNSRVRVVRRGHAQIHDAVAFSRCDFLLAPDVLQKSLDAPIVDTLIELTRGCFLCRVVLSSRAFL